jgi:hypothetical protein
MTGLDAAPDSDKHNRHLRPEKLEIDDSPPHKAVDHWLNIVTRQPGVASMQEGYVMCLVEKVCVQVRLSLSGLVILVESFSL